MYKRFKYYNVIKSGGGNMTLNGLSISLIVVGIFGLIGGSVMFGDIGIAAMTAGLIGVLSGYGFRLVGKVLKK